MNRRESKLKKIIERPRIIKHWAKRYRVTPHLVSKVFGNGKALLCLFPIMFRPQHFVVRIDSNWDIGGDEFRDRLDGIYDAIEEQYVEWPWKRMYGLKWDEDGNGDCSSRVRWGDGACWETMDWPKGVRP